MVLIPLGATEQPGVENNVESTTTTNTTNIANLVEFGKNLKLSVVEVVDLDQVMKELTGVDLNHKDTTIVENEEYAAIMKQLQEDLCARSRKIKAEILQNRLSLSTDVQREVEKAAQQAVNATLQGDYYSAASFCFSNNIRLKKAYYTEKKLSLATAEKFFEILREKNIALKQQLEQQPLETITALQTYGIVAERLLEVEEQLAAFEAMSLQNGSLQTEDYAPLLAYGEERYYSALSWQRFFQMSGKKLLITPETIKESCLEKISEAQERLQYVGLFVPPQFLGALPEKFAAAEKAQEEEKYPLCLITASQAKADANAILSSLGVDNSTFQHVVQAKQKAVARVIADNTAEGMFPLLGYSYYQYALTLQDQSPESALLYLEYALEMSDLGIYFPEEQEFKLKVRSIFPQPWMLPSGIGFVVGVIMTLLIVVSVKMVGKSKGKIEKKKKRYSK